METWQIRGGTLEYFDEEHIYLYEGVQLPSVTQILSNKWRNEFANIPRAVLTRASERGTNVHMAVEKYCKHGFDDGSQEVRNFKFLQKTYGFEVLDNELPVVIFDNDVAVACGRLDLTLEMNGEIGIGDIKTNSALNKEKIALQLNLYRLGLRDSYGVTAKFLKVIHIRDDVRKLIDLPINEEFTYEILHEYLERTQNEQS